MKKIIFYSLTLLLGLVLSSSGCVHDAPVTEADYYGTWKYEFSGFSVQVTLSANKLIYVNSALQTYTIENLTWAPVNNPSGAHIANYPTGYKITGTLKVLNSMIVLKSDDSGYAAVNDNAADFWYISIDKKSLMRGGTGLPSDHAAHEGPFVKQ